MRDAPKTKNGRPIVDPLRVFIHSEIAGGVFLLFATIAALIWVNINADNYFGLWNHKLAVLGENLELRVWVNDALMAIFFFVVGLEIKRELVVGELRDRRTAILPLIAASGGVIVPIALYWLIAGGTDAKHGWGIPAATDIAFAVGALALLGKRVSSGIRLMILSIAIIDDVLAILIIALFYAADLHLVWLFGSVGGVLLTRAMYHYGLASPAWYLIPWAATWWATLQSGIHPTIAGVALAMVVPAGLVKGKNVLVNLQEHLHSVSAFLIVPIFALANAGVVFSTQTVSTAFSSHVAWAIIVGLIVGKSVGIGGSIFLTVRSGIGRLPSDITPLQTWGLAFIAGIGFTVSLFITHLAFTDEVLIADAKIGIFFGSLVSAVIGLMILRFARPKVRRER